MLKEKEKRILLIVILGISLVSLVAALISGVVSGFMSMLNGITMDDTYLGVIGGLLTFVGTGLGVAYFVLYLIKKNYRNKAVIVLLFAQVGYFIFTLFSVYIGIAVDQGEYFWIGSYTDLATFIALMLSIIVPSALIWLVSHFLHKSNQKEETATVEANVENGESAAVEAKDASDENSGKSMQN